MEKQPLKYRMNVIGAALIIFLLIRAYVPFFAEKIGLKANFKIWVIICAITLILGCIVPIAFLENMCNHKFDIIKDTKEKFKTSQNCTIVAFAMFMLLVFNFVNSLILIFLQSKGIFFEIPKLPDLNGFLEYAMYFVYAVIIPAIFEELFIRYTVLNLLKAYGIKFALIMSSFIFMIMHTSMQSFLAIFAAGVTLACIYEYTKDIRVSMLLHAMNNSYSYFLQVLEAMPKKQTGEAMTMFITLTIISLGIVSITILKNKNMNIYSVLKGDEKGAKFLSCFKSPIFVLAIIGCFMVIFPQTYRAMVII